MSSSKQRILWCSLLVMIAVCTILALAAAKTRSLVSVTKEGSSTHTGSIVQPPLSTSMAAQGQGGGKRAEVQVQQITLWRTGFIPMEITRLAGPVDLVIVNNTGLRVLDLQLEEERGNSLKEVHLPEGKRHWQQYIDLHPGTYVITEVSHPEWVCRLNINSH
jgi:hypothetical protein